MHRLLRVVGLAVVTTWPAAEALAQPAPDVPAALAPWRNWVLYGEEFRACPVRNGTPPGQAANHVCAWPGALTLDVAATTAKFDQTWTVYAESWVPLPGNAELWPANVTAGVESQPVVLRDGRPMVRLARGTHRLAGTFAWSTRPASIPVPAEAGLVSLRLDGAVVPNPQLEGSTLWLGLRPEAEEEEDRLDVVVHRKLEDDLPTRLETHIALDIAGQAREVTLEGASIAGLVAESLDAELPAQLTPEGRLRVQVRPGQWEMTLVARAAAPPTTTLARPSAVEPWPADEIWSFAAEPRLRVAALEGAESVDPQRSGVPDDWRSLPSYRIAAGQSVNVVERSRNDAAQANRLRLARDLWLDFDGGGFTARDRVSGSMSSRWRLDMGTPYVMTMASIDEDSLLVTQGTEPGLQGVELRAANVNLTTTSRLARESAVPVSGYRESFDDVAATLHAPPGYRLVAAPGADRADGAWLERWRLLDVFVVLIMTVAVWRLFGPVGGAVALVALVVAFHEPGAPRWSWLNLVVALALLRVAPEGRLRYFARRYQWVSAALVALLLVPFTIDQVRFALHPQLERPMLGRDVGENARVRQFETRALPRAATGALETKREPGALEEITVTGSRIGGSFSRYVPGALVQTGPGLPDWTWTQYQLGFSGPVAQQQTVRLLLLGPAAVGFWRVASVVLTLALLWVLVGRPRRLPEGLVRGGAAAGLALGALLLAPPQRAVAQAASEFPSPQLLDELKARLTKPAPCHPACAEAEAASVEVRANQLGVDVTYALAAPAAVPLPGAARVWRPASVTVDAAPTGFLFRDSAEVAWLSLPEGVHRVALRGPLPVVDSVSIAFPLRPRRAAVTAPGWDIAGVSEGRLASGTVELVRQRNAAAGGQLGGSVFPPFVAIVRRISFDIDWRVRTTATRVAPQIGAFTLPIDLLANEAVLTPGIEVTGGRATVAFAAGVDEVAWESRLPTAETLTLAAPAAAAWSESWQFAVGQIWHADYNGVPATAPEEPDPALYVPEYHPRPGETLTLALRRPDPASGDTIAFDAVDYRRNVGARATQSTLDLKYRATRGMERRIALPPSSELERVAIDGAPVPLRLDGDALGLPVTPGKHEVEIAWRNADGPAFATHVVPVDLGGGASNVTATLHVPEDRWVLLAFGPRVGPAVLYWPELLAFIVIAFVLGRLALSPLRTHEWLLLGWGLSTFAWPVLVLFAAWAFAMSARARVEGPHSPRWFNALQVGLAVLTVAALAALLGAIPWGLLGQPDMQIVSPVSYDQLSWFADRIAGVTPDAGVVSVSIWFYKAAMLAWSLWLSFRLLRWLPWAWRAYSHGGLWRGRVGASA